MSESCALLHRVLNELTRYRYPFAGDTLPTNGIYILFECSELAHDGERIVRIGTHRGEEQLPSRLCQHFVLESKDRSIFRKNVGRCMLNRTGDPFLSHWEIDLTSRKARAKHDGEIDRVKLATIEGQVSEYIRGNFSFCVFGVDDLEERLTLESRIIATVAQCKECGSSAKWLGLYSPKAKIRNSGL